MDYDTADRACFCLLVGSFTFTFTFLTLFVIYRKVKVQFSWTLAQIFKFHFYLFRSQGQIIIRSKSPYWNLPFIIARPWCKMFSANLAIQIILGQFRETARCHANLFVSNIMIRASARREGGKGGKVFPGPATFGGPAIAQKYWNWCSRWLLSDLKYA